MRKIDAPLAAADIKNPLHKEWPENALDQGWHTLTGASYRRMVYAFHGFPQNCAGLLPCFAM